MAPHLLMLSERVLMNCLVDLMPYASQTRVSRATEELGHG